MLGNKHYSSQKHGDKNYGSHSLGNKNYNTINKSKQSHHSNSPDGPIHNYSNSSESQREPMKGVIIDNKRNIPKPMKIEKSRKRTETNTDFF